MIAFDNYCFIFSQTALNNNVISDFRSCLYKTLFRYIITPNNIDEDTAWTSILRSRLRL